jgi:transglutaminase-like putative cysteine protease
VSPSARRAHAVALATAIATLALSLRANPALALFLGLLAVLALFGSRVEWTSPPRRLASLLPRALALLMLAAALVGWASRSLGLLVLDPALLPSVAGPPVVVGALAFALAPRAFPPGRTLVPATIVLLGLAGLDPSPEGYGPSALPFLRPGEHNGFGEVYLLLALVVLAALWTAALRAEGPRWGRREAAAVLLAASLALALAAAGVVGLPLLQPRVEKMVVDALDAGTTGLSGESTLGEFGELAVSRRRVLDLRVTGGSERWRLRSEVFTAFDGRRWTTPAGARPRALRRSPAPAVALDLLAGEESWFLPEPAPPGPRVAELQATQAEVGRWPLLLPACPEAVAVSAPYLEVDRFGTVRRPHGLPVRVYGAVVGLEARTAGAPELSAADREEALALPPRMDERLRKLAAALALPDAGSRARVEATVRHLHLGYDYTLAPGAFRTDDPLTEFLFEKRAGYCEYFASAAVVLLRLQGVPARFVKGLASGPHSDQGAGLHVLRESDAHAWVEAFVPGEGWVEVDPTPPAQLDAARATPGALARFFERARAALSAAWARLLDRGPAALLRDAGRALAVLASRLVREPAAWLGLAAALVLPRLLRALRARRLARRSVREDGRALVPRELRDLVDALERRWRAADRPRPPGRGLREHAVAVGVGHEAVDVYYSARFGGATPPPAEVARLLSVLRTPPSPPA